MTGACVPWKDFKSGDESVKWSHASENGCRRGAANQQPANVKVSCEPGGGVGTPLCGLNGDVRPDRVRFSGCFVLNGVSISSISVLNRVSLHDLMT